MTYEDAIKVVENSCWNCNHLALCEHCTKDKIEEALNKQIPKKPRKRTYSKQYVGGNYCPTCDSIFEDETNYCDRCGQAIDWGE